MKSEVNSKASLQIISMIKDDVFDFISITASILFWRSWKHWKESFIVVLEWCNKFSNLEGFWFLDVDEKPFMFLTDFCIFIKLAVDAFPDEFIKSAN